MVVLDQSNPPITPEAVKKRLHNAQGTKEILSFINNNYPEITGIITTFCALSGIPRPSKQEEKVREFVIEIATEKGWQYRQDTAGNLAVYVPGVDRGRYSDTVCLQGHMDMVTLPLSHDFLNTPLHLRIDQEEFRGEMTDVLKATLTTLGADNGIGVAAMIETALNQPKDCPPLVLLFTADEETGLNGAMALDKSLLSDAKTLINLDSEDHETITISCSGGKGFEATCKRAKIDVPSDFIPLKIELRDLAGGHSGLEIHQKRGNASILLASAINETISNQQFFLSSFSGGDKRNAIPSWAKATIFVAKDSVDRTCVDLKDTLIKLIESEVDPEFRTKTSVVVNKNVSNEKAFDSNFSRDFISTLANLQNGVFRKYEENPYITATSSNLGVVETKGDTIHLVDNMRSSENEGFERLEQKLVQQLEKSGFAVKLGVGYPGWAPDPESPLLQKAKSTFKTLFGKEIEIVAVHAGLECGVVKTENMHAISFGPQINWAHSPQEHLVLSTVAPFNKFLRSLLTDLSR